MIKAGLALMLTVLFSAFSDAADVSPPNLTVTNSINAKTTFKVFRRSATNNHWENGARLAYTNGLALLTALEKSKQWVRKESCSGLWYAPRLYPEVTVMVDWSRTKKDSKTNSVSLCFGNRLFRHGGSLYQVPQSNYGEIDRLFPKNKPRKGTN
jgi:hypothetical protein